MREELKRIQDIDAKKPRSVFDALWRLSKVLFKGDDIYWPVLRDVFSALSIGALVDEPKTQDSSEANPAISNSSCSIL